MGQTIETSKYNRQYYKTVFVTGFIITLLICTAIFFFAKDNMVAGIATLLLPVPVIYLYLIFKFPKVSFISVLFCNYFAIGLSRYIPAPVGLTVDATLLLTFIAILFSQFNHKVEWKLAGKDLTYIALIWFGMTVLQLINPQTISREAWFYAMRSQSLYILLIVPLVYLVFNKPKDMDTFISLCAWFTLFAVFKGLMQKYMGLDRWEQQWLNLPGNLSTHMLFGKLRVFSFFSDAGTYGGTMGYFGVLYIILAIHDKRKQKKIFYYIVGVMSLYAMLISGTRSAIAVPLVGFVLYTILTKKFKIMILVGGLVFSIFFILKYTSIGQGNYDIRRMRSAFDGDNASLNVRNENRRIFANYLQSKPFGGGIGSSGNWGLRFTPYTLLAQTPTDGWYIQLWAEQGVIGLTAYLLMIFYFVIKSTLLIFYRIKKPENLYKAIAFTSGMYGLIVSSYTASSLGQMPNTIIVFTSMVLISLMTKWEKDEAQTTINVNHTSS